MATTAGELVNETRRLLLSSSREQYGQLTSTITSAVTSIPVTNDPGITAGSVIEIDSELIYVWTPSTVVTRGWLGTTAAAHTAGALITVNPRWPTINVYKSLSDEIVSYASPAHGLFQISRLTLTSAAATAAYNLAGAPAEPGLIDIYDVRVNMPGVTGDWPRVVSWELDRNPDPTGFPSGYALRVYSDVLPGRTVQVQYKGAFSAFPAVVDLTSLVSLTGLNPEAHDIPPLGAAARLLAVREARRSLSDAQPEPRQAVESPPGTSRNAAGGLLALRNARLAEERVRLQTRYPAIIRRAS